MLLNTILMPMAFLGALNYGFTPILSLLIAIAVGLIATQLTPSQPINQSQES